MAKRGENIYLRKDGRYEGRYVVGKKSNGKTAFGYIYGKKYSEVKRKLSIIKGEYAKGTRVPIALYSEETVASWLHIWLENYIDSGIKRSTLGVYKGLVQKHIIPHIGEIKLREVDKDTMRNLYFKIQETGGSQQTAQNVCKRFRNSLMTAQEENFIHAVPGLPFKRACSMKKEPRYLSSSEQRHLEGLLTLDDPRAMAVFLSLYTGVRIGECCALKWEDIDFEGHEISISHTLQRVSTGGNGAKTDLLYTSPKSQNAIRKIPMTESLEKKLKEFKRNKSEELTEFVFEVRQKPLEPRNLQYYIKKLEKISNLSGLHFHSLRHTFATRCLELQMDIKTLSELLGHSSAQITLDWYCHSSRSRKQTLIQMLDHDAA